MTKQRIFIMLIKVTNKNLANTLKEAVRALERGGIVAFPTETFYGLGAKFNIESALEKLYALKKRPEEKPMPLIIGDMGMLAAIAANVSDTASVLMNKYWPGPLTLLLKAKKGLSKYLTAKKDKIAVRIPGESIALHLVREAGFPITATSANISGMPPAKNAETVIKYFGDKIDLIIDGGKTTGGLPSTIVDVTGRAVKILREGAVSSSDIKNFLKKRA